MKTCPKCKTSYTDQTLNFCLSDGSTLNTDIIGEKTVDYKNSKVEDVINESDKSQMSDTRANATTLKYTLSKEKRNSGSLWKFTTLGLFAILITVIVSFWLISPERLKALGAAISFPVFKTASQEGEIIVEGKGNSGSNQKGNKPQTSNSNLIKRSETSENSSNTNENSGITGRWEIALKTPRRNYPMFWDLQVDEGGKIFGVSNSPFGKDEIKNAKLEKGVLTIELNRPMALNFVGTIVDENIEGKVYTKLGPTTFTGKKISDESESNKKKVEEKQVQSP